jgi:hypothetical protein
VYVIDVAVAEPSAKKGASNFKTVKQLRWGQNNAAASAPKRFPLRIYR